MKSRLGCLGAVIVVILILVGIGFLIYYIFVQVTHDPQDANVGDCVGAFGSAYDARIVACTSSDAAYKVIGFGSGSDDDLLKACTAYPQADLVLEINVKMLCMVDYKP